jgi:hypothetical protein
MRTGPPSLYTLAFAALLARLSSLPPWPPAELAGLGVRLGAGLPEDAVLQLLQGEAGAGGRAGASGGSGRPARRARRPHAPSRAAGRPWGRPAPVETPHARC